MPTPLPTIIHSKQVRAMHYLAVFFCLLTTLIASFVLAGWIFEIPQLTSLHPQWVSMKVNTAIGFLLVSCSLMLALITEHVPSESTKRQLSRIYQFFGVMIFLLGLLQLIQEVTDIDLNIDNLWIEEPIAAMQTSSPGRMSIGAAINFLLLGLLLVLYKKKDKPLAQIFILYVSGAVLFLSSVAAIGYVTGASALYEFQQSTSMAAHTAVGFILLVSAYLLIHSNIPFLSDLFSRSSTGRLLRHTLPLAVLVMPFIYTVIDFFVQSNAIDHGYANAFILLSSTLAVVYVSWKGTRLIVEERQAAENVFTQIPSAILISNENGVVKFYNKGAQKLFGSDLSCSNANLSELGFNIEWLRSIDSTPRTLFMSFMRRGENHQHLVSGIRLKTRTGVRIAITLLDMTEQIDLEDKLNSTVATLRLALDSANIGVWTWDLKTNELDWDEQMLALYEVPKSTASTSMFYDFWVKHVHPEDIRAAELSLQNCIQGISSYSVEFRVINDDGEVLRWIQAAGMVDKDEHGVAIKVTGLNWDITDRVVAERKLQSVNRLLETEIARRTSDLTLALKQADEAYRSKDEFFSNMSHEIRTPMNSILGVTYLLKNTPMSDESKSMVQQIDESAHILLRLIDDILDMSKIQAKRMELESAPFDLQLILNRVATVLSIQIKNKDIEPVVYPLPENIRWLLGDGFRLEQVINNLISNACKFTSQGMIELKTELVELGNSANTSKVIRIRVSDTGIGISKDKITTIFDEYTQANTSTAREYGGSGLGLAISKYIITNMDGRIYCESELDKGSQFTLEIPYLPVNVPTPSLTDPPINNLHVLIVDDEPQAMQVISQLVTSLSWTYISFGSALQALEYLRENTREQFDVILLDKRMPELDGLALAAEINRLRPDAQDTMLLMLTTSDSDLLSSENHCNLIAGVIQKPATPSTLLNAVLSSLNIEVNSSDTFDNKEHCRLADIKILVVDDNYTNLDLTRRILTREGADVLIAEGGQQAVDNVVEAGNSLDIVLMDIQMPGMDGYETTKKINALGLAKTLPVLALSAGAFPEQKRAAREAGMIGFVSKPINVDTLVATISNAIDNPQSNLIVEDREADQADSSVFDLALLAPLFDVDTAMFIWSDERSLAKHLNIFNRHWQNWQPLSYLNANSDIKELATEAHNLAGVAGNLGLKQLSFVARKCEQLANKDLPSLPELTPNVEQLSRTLTDTIILITSFLDMMDNFENAKDLLPDVDFKSGTDLLKNTLTQEPVSQDKKILRETLFKKAIEALQNDDFELADNLLNQLSESINHSLSSVRKAMDEFDLRAAEKALNEIKNSSTWQSKEM